MSITQNTVDSAPPSHVLLMLTYRCNLRCPYCLVFDPVRYWAADDSVELPRAVAEREMTTEDIVGRVIPQCEASGVKVMALTGGEVMLRRDTGRLFDALGRSGLDWCIDTNLSRCTDSLAETIIAAGCTTVFVSIDGPEPTHNELRASRRAYGEAVTGLDRLLRARSVQSDARTQMVANCVMQTGNEHVPLELVDWAAARGLSGICFQLLSRYTYRPGFRADVAVRALDEARRLAGLRGIDFAIFPINNPTADELTTWYTTPPAGAFFSGCDYIYSSARIDPAGNMIPCAEHQLGNILEEDLLDIWRGPNYAAFRNRITVNPLSACSRCCNLTIQK